MNPEAFFYSYDVILMDFGQRFQKFLESNALFFAIWLGELYILSLTRRARVESLTFPREEKVKPIILFSIQNASRTSHNHDEELYLAIPLFLRTKFFEI